MRKLLLFLVLFISTTILVAQDYPEVSIWDIHCDHATGKTKAIGSYTSVEMRAPGTWPARRAATAVTLTLRRTGGRSCNPKPVGWSSF